MTVHTFTNISGTKVEFVKDIELFPGYKVNGTVTIGDDNQPVDSARVYLDGNESIFTFTDAKGKYQLGKFRAK